jgi:catalase (peroxidase I)
MDMAVGLDKAIAPQWLRLSFHDAGTFDQRVPEGGANGCLLTNAEMRLQPENHNLDLAIETLLFIREQMITAAPDPIRLTAADLIQFAGFFVAVRQRGTLPGLTTAKRTELQTSFQWGRPDEPNCQVRWTTNLPGFALGTDPLDIPLRCLFAGKEVKGKMMDRNGFTAREATVLIGAHTIGMTRNVFGPFLAAPWVTNGADAATRQGPVFDNAYHKFLIGATPTSTVDGFSRSRVPFDEDFPDWFRANTMGLNHLDTDMALAFPSQNLNVHPHYDTFSKEFAASNTEFIKAFMLALNKMSKLGVKVTLQSPLACAAGRAAVLAPVTPSAEYTDLLLAAVATAEDDLDATLLARQAEITVQTTPVVGAGP